MFTVDGSISGTCWDGKSGKWGRSPTKGVGKDARGGTYQGVPRNQNPERDGRDFADQGKKTLPMKTSNIAIIYTTKEN